MFRIIYAVQHDVMPIDFEDNLVFTDGEYEMMLFENETLIEVEGEMREFPPHTGIIYKPGQRIHYRAKNGNLIYTWIRFDCDEPLFADGYVPFGVPIYCENYDYFLKYWELVACENYWNKPSKEYIVSDLMHIIFHWFHDSAFPKSNARYQTIFERLRAEIYAHPEYDWSLENMAKKVNLSTRSLQKLYKNFSNISCIAEVVESRMTRAKMLLARTSLDIGEISAQCGYNNVEHFCRQFRKKEGSSPSTYRKNHQVNS